ncbi:hypothetical protein PENTCL1PPCAC_19177, partial [Pristionchus entomophagus]
DVHFVREYQMVKGVIGGIEVEACLDTGADVNLIDKSTVDRMNGVVLDTSKSYRIRDAGGNIIKTVGRTVLEVEMNVGRKCRVGFVVAEHCDAILLGAVALEAMGMELRLKEESREEAVESPDNATVLRTVYVAPGELCTVLVSGGRPGEGPKVLISEREDIVEGTNEKALIVRVPVWNSTESDIVFEKHDIVGVWKKVQGLNREDVQFPELTTECHRVNRCMTADRSSDWEEIKENLEICRGGQLNKGVEEILRTHAAIFAVQEEDLGRLQGMECEIRLEGGCGIGAVLSQLGNDQVERPIGFFSRGLRDAERSLTVVDTEALAVYEASRWDEEEKRRKEREDIEESDNVNQWRIDQSKDEWVVKMIGWLSEVEEKKRDIGEEVTIPGSTKRTCLADWVVHRGILYLLSIDHEKRLYVPEGRREKFIEEIHNSPLSGHLCTRKMVQKLSSEVFWGSMHRDVQTVLKRCERCLLANSQKRMIPPLQPLVAKRFEIERRLTLSYHSRANGLTERFNRTIIEIVKRIKMMDDQWEEALSFAVYAYNASPHGSTGETPSFLMYGREDRLPNSQIPKENPLYTVDMDVDQYKRRMSWMMEKTRSVVITKLEAERKKMKEKYDTKNANNMKIQPKKGDRVYIRVEPKPGDIRKMVAQFDGPFRVEGTSNTTVTVERIDSGLDGNRGRDRRVVQWDRVRLVPKENEE